MFTIRNLKKKDLQSPPVDGCKCTYCENMRDLGTGCRGVGSHRSHRLPDGNEAHNPENVYRLSMATIVSKEAFKTYVSKPGGNVLWFQGKSGLWYRSGRCGDNWPGHFVHCHTAKDGGEIAWLCLPPESHTGLPLAGVVLGHYFLLTTNEEDAWHTAVISYVRKELVPPHLEVHIVSVSAHNIQHGHSSGIYNKTENK